MGSLDKVKPGNNALERWFGKYSGPFLVSDKLDGISGLYMLYVMVSKNYIQMAKKRQIFHT